MCLQRHKKPIMKHLLTISLCFLALSLSVYGQNNYSMSFDGVDDYISTSNDVFTNSDIQQGTVSCNVNLNDTLADRHIFSLEGYVDIGLRKANSSVINCSWPLTSINAVSDGSSLCGGTGVYYPINLISNTNDWINISITWDGVDFIRMYIDGVLVSSSIPNSFPNVDATNRPITFGVHSSFNWSNYLGGNIDDIHLWDIPLSPQEIEQYISCPPVGNESGLIGLWIFEEGSGSTVYDQTANGNNGTINGATYSIDTPEQNCVGCIDPVSCNYIPYATVDDGSCDYSCCPGPGCCLDGQNWDWDLMGCVITNPTDSNLDGCTDLNDLMDLLASYGDCGLAGFTTCGDDIEYEGYSYSTVQIGDRWFAENCRYLPAVSPSSAQSTTDPYYYVYDYQGTDVTSAQATSSFATYGVLYNWPAVMTEGLCPSGWHIPSDGEWQTLEISLGMSESDAAIDGWRGSPVGDYMKSTTGWSNNGNGLNPIGFIALPGGSNYSGVFSSTGLYGHWWSASESGSSARRRVLNYYDDVYRDAYNRDDGFSARCVRD
jgi:uncharacterized protein (TIGR02145 family)